MAIGVSSGAERPGREYSRKASVEHFEGDLAASGPWAAALT